MIAGGQPFHHSIHTQTKVGAGKRRRAFRPIRTRFLPSADSISDKSRASHLSHLITSLHDALPEVARHTCMSHHIDRSICVRYPPMHACMCSSSVTMLLDNIRKLFRQRHRRQAIRNPSSVSIIVFCEVISLCWYLDGWMDVSNVFCGLGSRGSRSVIRPHMASPDAAGCMLY